MSQINYPGRFNGEFNECRVIGVGSRSVVVQVEHKYDEKYYAIKKIKVSKTDEAKILREMRIWAKLDNDYFVRYISNWTENYEESATKQSNMAMSSGQDTGDMDIEEEITPISFFVLHYQMEYCPFSLKEAVNHLRNYFGIKENSKSLFGALHYYILSELLLEILEALNYLHEFKPEKILHRDIKPTNILIKPSYHGKFIKIGDFGLAVQLKDKELRTQLGNNSNKYLAPEVLTGRVYDTSADVYSVGILAQEMFNFDIYRKLEMDEQYQSLRDIVERSLGSPRDRPSCAQWIHEKNNWAGSYNHVKDTIPNLIRNDQEFNINTNFVLYFLKTKSGN